MKLGFLIIVGIILSHSAEIDAHKAGKDSKSKAGGGVSRFQNNSPYIACLICTHLKWLALQRFCRNLGRRARLPKARVENILRRALRVLKPKFQPFLPPPICRHYLPPLRCRHFLPPPRRRHFLQLLRPQQPLSLPLRQHHQQALLFR